MKAWASHNLLLKYTTTLLLLHALPLMAANDEKIIEELLNKVLKEGPAVNPGQPVSGNLTQPKTENKNPELEPVQKKSDLDLFRQLSAQLIKSGKIPAEDLRACEFYSKKFFHTDLGLNSFFLYHKVQPGESLSSIARKYHITAARIAEFNPDFDPNRIFPGQKIKIVKGPNYVLVSKSDYQMYLFIQGVLFEHFPIGIGREGKSTPILKTKLSDSRAKYPTYTHPETKITYPFGHPENPIGTRWMGFEGYPGYGIHGTNDESSIGKAMSSGCIRMRQPDLEHIYNLLFIGDDVEIKP